MIHDYIKAPVDFNKHLDPISALLSSKLFSSFSAVLGDKIHQLWQKTNDLNCSFHLPRSDVSCVQVESARPGPLGLCEPRSCQIPGWIYWSHSTKLYLDNTSKN